MAQDLFRKKQRISVVGAAAVGDYIFQVERLPQPGEVVQVSDFNEEIQFGGCAPNIATCLGKLGKCQPVLHYPVGEDYAPYLDAWHRNGIVCEITVGSGKSGISWMFMQKDGGTMCFSWEGVANTLKWPAASRLDEYVMIAPLLNDFTKGCIEQAIEEHRKIFVTGIANLDLIPYLPHIDYLSINNYEFSVLCAALGIDPEDFGNRFSSLELIVTMGSRGSKVSKGSSSYSIPVIETKEIIDFTGAGDAYAGGYLSARIAGFDMECSGYVGSATSSCVLEQFGGQQGAPDWDTVISRIAKQYPAICKRIQEREGL